MIMTDADRAAREAEHARIGALSPLDRVVEEAQRDADQLVRWYVVSHRDGEFRVRTFRDGHGARDYWQTGARFDGLEAVRVITPADTSVISPAPTPSAAALRRPITAAQRAVLERHADGNHVTVGSWRTRQALADRGLIEHVRPIGTHPDTGRRYPRIGHHEVTSAGLIAIGR